MLFASCVVCDVTGGFVSDRTTSMSGSIHHRKQQVCVFVSRFLSFVCSELCVCVCVHLPPNSGHLQLPPSHITSVSLSLAVSRCLYVLLIDSSSSSSVGLRAGVFCCDWHQLTERLTHSLSTRFWSIQLLLKAKFLWQSYLRDCAVDGLGAQSKDMKKSMCWCLQRFLKTAIILSVNGKVQWEFSLLQLGF